MYSGKQKRRRKKEGKKKKKERNRERKSEKDKERERERERMKRIAIKWFFVLEKDILCAFSMSYLNWLVSRCCCRF